MLPRSKRVTTELFKKITERGFSVHTPVFSMRFLSETTLCPSRFSVVVPKKVLKSAVKRNNLKRRVSAVLRKVYPSLKDSFIGVIYAKNATVTLPYKELLSGTEELFKRAHIIK